MEKLCALAEVAGRAVMEVYGSSFDVEYKEDDSPLTKADKRSHDIIAAGLGRLYPEIPVISEEGKDIPYETRKGFGRFFLVDPLDGTKEFVKRGGDFTVNIALVEGEDLAAGVIYVPVTGVLYWGSLGKGAWKKEPGSDAVRIRTAKPSGDARTVVQSRSHPSEKLAKYLEGINVKGTVPVGSSLKFCMVAEGTADLYPRLGPTWEWDTAAGQCIVEAAGGKVELPGGGRLRYNKPTLLNDSFIVYA